MAPVKPAKEAENYKLDEGSRMGAGDVLLYAVVVLLL